MDFYLDNKSIAVGMGGTANAEAAKDEAFRKLGFEVSPIGNDAYVTSEDMKDPSKTRRFRYYGGNIDMEEFVQYYTIKDGQVECDDTIFLDHLYIEGLDEYMEKYYLDDIKKNSTK